MAWEHKQRMAFAKVMATLYPTNAEQRALAQRAKLNVSIIPFDAVALTSWIAIVKNAHDSQGGALDRLIDVALEDYGDNALLQGIKADVPMDLPPAPSVEGEWKGTSANALEKITGDVSALVDVSFLAKGLDCARSVALIELPTSRGTGFLIDNDILVTNNHVLADAASAKTAKAKFNYQQALKGGAEVIETFDLDPDALFETSKENDYTFVKVKDDAAGNLAKWRALSLAKRPVAVGDRVNIIQHPGGGPKQISFFSNVVAFVGNGRVQYLTDTLPGSSGAPVFDREWNIVALHHSGGWIREPGGDPKKVNLRNEGIDVSILVDALAH